MFTVESIPGIQNDVKQCSTNKQIHSKYGNLLAMDDDDDADQDELDD